MGGFFSDIDDTFQNITETAGNTLQGIFENPFGALEDFWTVTDGTLMNYDDSKGLLENIYDKWNPYLDQYSPGHQTAQDAIVDAGGFDSELEAFSTIAPMVVNYFLPGVGSYLTEADAISRGDYENAAMQAALSYANYTDGTSPSVNTSIGNAVGLEGNAANAFGSAFTRAGAAGLTGQDLDQALITGAISGLSNYAGSSLSDAGVFDSQWANNALGTVGGMATGYGLNSLFNDQGGSSFSPLTGSYYGSTPVASSLNTTDGGQTGYTTSKPTTTSAPGVATDSATSDYGGLESYVSGDWKPQTDEQLY